ncbi:ribokinase [Angustibacter peucedani]
MSAAERPHVVVVGSTMTDQVVYLDRAPAAGETVVGRRFVVGFGGKGANQAVMAARLGAHVRFVGCLGDDANGETYLAHLADEGVDVRALVRRPGPSGVAPIWVELDGTNRIVVVPGANDLVTADDARAAVASAEPVDVVVGQLEIPQAATAAGLAAGRERGATTVLNPAPFAAVDDALLAAADWLVPNEVEFAELAVQRGLVDDQGAADPHDDIQVLALAAATGCAVVVTLGERGAALTLDGAVQRVAAPVVQAVDTTGAGDGFVGAFVVGLAEGLTPQQAASLACACASWSVQRDGTQTSFPTAAEAAGLRDAVVAG